MGLEIDLQVSISVKDFETNLHGSDNNKITWISRMVSVH